MISHKKNTAYYLSFPMVDSASPAAFKTGLTPTDTAYYKDGAGAWTSLAITDTASEIGSTGVYEIDFSAAELNHDKVLVVFSSAGAATTAFMFDLTANSIDELATAASLATVDANIDSILLDTGTTIPAQISALQNVSVNDLLYTQLTESYAAAGAAPTVAQALLMIQQMLGDFNITGTTLQVNKLNGSTVAANYTLNDPVNPTGNSRSS
jgi:hypothetical protein